MRIEITRGDRGETVSTMTRPDGVTVRLRGYDRAHAVPHDLSHLATERALGLTAGVWGLVAGGVVFGSVDVVDGRPRHDWKVRSQRLLDAHADDLAVAELLNGVVHFHALGRVRDLEAALREAWGTRTAEAYPFGSRGTEAAEALVAMTARWTAAGTLTEEWPLRPPALTGTPRPRSGGRGRGR